MAKLWKRYHPDHRQRAGSAGGAHADGRRSPLTVALGGSKGSGGGADAPSTAEARRLRRARNKVMKLHEKAVGAQVQTRSHDLIHFKTSTSRHAMQASMEAMELERKGRSVQETLQISQQILHAQITQCVDLAMVARNLPVPVRNEQLDQAEQE